MKTHTVKSWSPFFQAIKRGDKTHDLRYDCDRHFEVGDRIVLQEYEPFEGRYTGEECTVIVTYITSNRTPCAFSSAVLDKDYAILSIKLEKGIEELQHPSFDIEQITIAAKKRAIGPNGGVFEVPLAKAKDVDLRYK
jgi:hypothetical protein